ncbi:hypothetical protein yc1106_03297 [Curvularia clavata]|uniref:Uncharacterized protein n=1 Tax=Curvularia clavata TaxID=95742 RepID=A0A9Q8Z901_CURCL|nr:hypothetical protein yc1106_03297 [Curvularia clavata]
MAFFRSVTDRFWNYISPRKTQQRRDKPFAFKTPAVPPRITNTRQEAVKPVTTKKSPKARVETRGAQTLGPQYAIDATLLPPSPPASAMLSDDLEGDTLVSLSPLAPEQKMDGSSEDEWDANEETMVVDDGTYMDQQKLINIEEERRRRDQQGRQLRAAGWSEDAVFLFQKLGMRGLEPLLPADWICDFETLPGGLFTEKLDKAFIKPAFGTDHSAQNALSRLFDLGGVVRDAWHTRAKRTPEFHIGKAVKAYMKWAMKDGKVGRLWSQLPLFHTTTFSRLVHPSVSEEKMIEKLGRLHELWHDALQIDETERHKETIVAEVPTLYGITASHTVVAFVSYAPPTKEGEQPHLRLIAMYDYGKEGYDVWNALSIAIFILHCRNRMMQLRECLSEPEVLSEEDPDL